MLLIEGLRQLDEVRRLEKMMPAPQVLLAISSPLSPPLRDLSPVQLDLLQAVHNFRRLQSVLDHAPGTDLEVLSGIKTLLDRGYLEVG